MDEKADQEGILFKTAQALEDLEIPYMLTGSYALFFYSEPRYTNDIDIVIDVIDEQLDALLGLFDSAEGWYTSREAAIEAIHLRRMFNVIHTPTGVKIDFAVLKGSEFEREKFRRRQRHARDGMGIWIISAEDLLLSKLAWGADSGSAKQADDVRALIRDVPELDWNYVNDRAARIGVSDWLTRIRAGGYHA